MFKSQHLCNSICEKLKLTPCDEIEQQLDNDNDNNDLFGEAGDDMDVNNNDEDLCKSDLS